MTIAVGDRLPDTKLKVMTADGVAEKSTAELFGSKKVVLFAVPGAFTPTCHRNHLPGFLENLDHIKAKGIDEVAVVAVNDIWVMDAWATASGGKGKIEFLADAKGEFTKKLGLDHDNPNLGLRSKRYCMVVEDGVVKSLEVEDQPGQATVSGAAALLERL